MHFRIGLASRPCRIAPTAPSLVTGIATFVNLVLLICSLIQDGLARDDEVDRGSRSELPARGRALRDDASVRHVRGAPLRHPPDPTAAPLNQRLCGCERPTGHLWYEALADRVASVGTASGAAATGVAATGVAATGVAATGVAATGVAATGCPSACGAV